MERSVTRRGFVAGSAVLAGCAGAAALSSIPSQSYAEEANHATEEENAEILMTLCDGCGNKCGVKAWVVDGKLARIIGDPNHPNSGGWLCGRGQGFSSITYSEDRLTHPMKKNPAGVFEEISWEDAYDEISEALNRTAPDELAVFQARDSAAFFVQRFANALGSANYFSDSALHDQDIVATIEAISGAYPAPQVKGSKYIVMLNKSTYDGCRPKEAREFAERHENREGKLILVDPRLTAFASMADEWVNIRPGAELAFLLGIAGELIRNNKYDKTFVETWGNGFDEFSNTVKDYSLDWAAEKTDISADKLAEIAEELADAAPHCFIDMPWAGTFGAGYVNSADTVRMTYLLNAMLGNFNQEGGWIFGNTPFVADQMLDPEVIRPLDPPSTAPMGSSASPMLGSRCGARIDEMRDGQIKAAIFVETNPVLDYPAKAKVEEALDTLECMVVCDSVMTDTALKADYILPLDTYFECAGTINTEASDVSAATLRKPIIERVNPDTRTVSEIICELANRCGKEAFFDFTIDDYNQAWADAAGIDYKKLKEDATLLLEGSDVDYGSMPYLRTESGKIDFASPVFEQAGLSRVPVWTEPYATPGNGKLRLLIGEQAINSHTYTTLAPQLISIAKHYDLDRAWINDQAAEELGIKDGDSITITSDEGSITAVAKVTPRIHPEAIWLPSHYGFSEETGGAAAGFGVAPKQLVSINCEPGTGAAMMNETLVTIEKAGE
ncbi:MAG: molybdopterin-dependent oxidoreductase [Eggerthellaceae bacterium]|nr:molybdopterin-dependent oxidoreductase [Eggerthellaceae bacterium]